MAQTFGLMALKMRPQAGLRGLTALVSFFAMKIIAFIEQRQTKVS
jgi:hypothetical protein